MHTLNIYFPSTASTTLETRSVRVPTGKWRVVGAHFTPATTAAAGDGSNNVNATLSTADGAGGSATVRATLSGNGAAFTINVPREFVLASGLTVDGGQVLILAKTITGTGGVLDGDCQVVLEKVN